MHIPDGLLSVEVSGVTAALAIAGLGFGVWRQKREAHKLDASHGQEEDPLLLLPVVAAFVFAAQMLNFPVGLGVSAHFLGAALAAVLLGPWNAGLVLTLVLVPQMLFFADGGATALGANTLNMGVVGGIGAGLALSGIAKFSGTSKRSLVIASGVAAWLSVMAATLAVCLQVALSGKLGFIEVFATLGSFNAIAGIGEAVITAAAVGYIAHERPDLIRGWPKPLANTSDASSKVQAEVSA